MIDFRVNRFGFLSAFCLALFCAFEIHALKNVVPPGGRVLLAKREEVLKLDKSKLVDFMNSEAHSICKKLGYQEAARMCIKLSDAERLKIFTNNQYEALSLNEEGIFVKQSYPFSLTDEIMPSLNTYFSRLAQLSSYAATFSNYGSFAVVTDMAFNDYDVDTIDQTGLIGIGTTLALMYLEKISASFHRKAVYARLNEMAWPTLAKTLWCQ